MAGKTGIWICWAISCLSALSLPAQTDGPAVAKVVGLRLFQGYLLRHSTELQGMDRTYPRGMELSFSWHNSSKKAWNSCNCYTRLGISTTAWNYDNPEVLGWGIHTLFLLEPVFGAGNLFSLYFQAGAGLSFQNKPYHPETNLLNQSYSTYVAFPLRLGVGTNIRLHRRWYMDVLAAYNHFSNGGMKEPNKGLNWLTASMGLIYYIDEPQFYKREKVPWRSLRGPETRLDISLFGTYQQPTGIMVFSLGGEVKLSRQVARINALTIGAEWFWDNGRRYEMAKNDIDGQSNNAGLALGHEFILGRFLFAQQFGVYLLAPTSQKADVYQRYGLVYRLTPKWAFGIALKAHGHVADFLDVRVVFSLSQRKPKTGPGNASG